MRKWYILAFIFSAALIGCALNLYEGREGAGAALITSAVLGAICVWRISRLRKRGLKPAMPVTRATTSPAPAATLKEQSEKLAIKTDFIQGQLRTDWENGLMAQAADITNLTSKQQRELASAVAASILPGGQGLYTLLPEVEKICGLGKNECHKLALEQTRRANCMLTRLRMLENGAKEFEWVSAKWLDSPCTLNMVEKYSLLPNHLWCTRKPANMTFPVKRLAAIASCVQYHSNK